MLSLTGIIIESSSDTYIVGTNVTITCHSDTDTVKMEWIRDKDVIVAAMPNTRQLDLSFTPVNDSVHNKVFTCRVTINDVTVAEQNFTMRVTSEYNYKNS